MISAESFPVISTTVQVMAALFVFLVGVGVLVAIILFVIDVTQTKSAIRRNYPVVGRFRYFFEHLGEFFRQYFFAMDREELPFNRAQRSWAYRASKNIDNTVAFGSTRDLRPTGTVLFVNCPFPTLGQDAVPASAITIGPYCRQPYTTSSLFNISGMSYGAISRPAVLALSNGAREAGCWMNTGEGGLSPYHLEGAADIVFQIGTAKNGVRDLEGNLNDDRIREVAAHETVRMFEIKMSQGAKPGKGGILPGGKVTEEIAGIRGIPPGSDAISPNRHIDINSNSDLLDMIRRVREVSGKPTGFKTVIGAYGWLDELFTEINRRGIETAPDFITVDGADGGTGAAPMPLIDDVGLPLRESLPLLVDKLNEHGLRERVRVIASGKLITPADVAWALCLGTDFVVSARGFMFALGCIQALQCNKNTCPTGITTHNKRLQKGLDPQDKAVRVANYAKNIVYEVGIIAHSCGVREPRQLQRFHARVVTDNGLSVALNDLHPDVTGPENGNSAAGA
ncbi:MAG: FMN-binding glutamate synthase family protein [Gammaproteobacteria bacterium]|nr:MAG: FMN-binding glutamate synthase family protein [Gammaproteobacteria bacterium]